MNGQRSNVKLSVANSFPLHQGKDRRITWQVPQSTSEPATHGTAPSAAVTSFAYPHLHSTAAKTNVQTPTHPTSHSGASRAPHKSPNGLR